MIFRDIHRTFPAHEFFREAGGAGQEALFRQFFVNLYDVFRQDLVVTVSFGYRALVKKYSYYSYLIRYRSRISLDPNLDADPGPDHPSNTSKTNKDRELQFCGSMTFWGGSGSGSADPCL